MIEITGKVLKTSKQVLGNGTVLLNHHFLSNGSFDEPAILKVQDWEGRSFQIGKDYRVPVRVQAWKSKSGQVGVQYTLPQEFEVK